MKGWRGEGDKVHGGSEVGGAVQSCPGATSTEKRRKIDSNRTSKDMCKFILLHGTLSNNTADMSKTCVLSYLLYQLEHLINLIDHSASPLSRT